MKLIHKVFLILFLPLIFAIDKLALCIFWNAKGLEFKKWMFNEPEIIKSLWRITIFCISIVIFDLIIRIVE